MPAADAASFLASGAIALLRWWTLLAPLGVLAALALQARYGAASRTALVLALAAVVPPLFVLLPVTAMGVGWQRLLALAAIVMDAGAAALAAAALRRGRRRGRSGSAAVLIGLAGSMLGALALLALISL